MITRTSVWFTLAVFVAVGLQLYNATSFLPYSEWSLWQSDAEMTTQQIILYYAVLPRGTVAFLAGAMLGLAGALFQQLFRNPIADSSTLGISAGAQLAIVSATLFAPSLVDEGRSAVAIAGAGIAASVVFFLAWRRRFDPVAMVIAGMLVSITTSAIAAAMTISQGEYLMSLVTWNGGALSQQDWEPSFYLTVAFAAALTLGVALARPLHLLSFGEEVASGLGVRITQVRVAVAALGVLLTGLVSAFVGLVSFVGLAAPHIVRACGTRDARSMLAFSALAGGLLLWICDGFVQIIASSADESFPTGAITGLLGGPLLLWLLSRIRHTTPGRAYGQQVIRPAAPMLAAIGGCVAIVTLASFFVAQDQGGWLLLSMSEFQQIFSMRWPRVVATAAAGGLLGVSGAMLQRLTSNPLAGPEVLGVSGGAGIGFAAVLTLIPAPTQAEIILGSVVGATISTAVVTSYGGRRQLEPERLLLAGVAVSSLTSAVLGALLAIGDQRSWQILNWLAGSAATVTGTPALTLAGIATVVLACSLLVSRWLTLLPLGHSVSTALGVPLRPAKVLVIVLAAVSTGAASLLVGPLSFVGLLAPHIALRAGFSRSRDQLTASFVLGSALMLLADLGARNLTFPYELPLGLFAALIGAPYLTYLVSRRA